MRPAVRWPHTSVSENSLQLRYVTPPYARALASPVRRPSPAATCAALLAGALLYLSLQDRRGAASDYYENVALLRQIKELDATWESDVLKARLGIMQDGDALAATLRELDRLPK
eukprot:gene2275-2958_t